MKLPVVDPQNITWGIVGGVPGGFFFSHCFLHIPIRPNMVEFMKPVRSMGGVAPLYRPFNYPKKLKLKLK
jgi:hypothetical protein